MSTSAAVLTACAVSNEGDLRIGDPCTQGFIDEVKLEQALASAIPCCGSFDQMSFVAPRQGYIMTLGKESPVFEFPSGKSRFIALDLRDFTGTRAGLFPLASTALTAPPDYTCAGQPMALVTLRAVKPVVQWLDANKKPLGEAQRGKDTLVTPVAGWMFERPPQAQYMVVYSNPKEYGTRLELAAPPAGRLMKTETVGLAAGIQPQRTFGPATFTATSTGYFESLIPGPMQ